MFLRESDAKTDADHREKLFYEQAEEAVNGLELDTKEKKNLFKSKWFWTFTGLFLAVITLMYYAIWWI